MSIRSKILLSVVASFLFFTHSFAQVSIRLTVKNNTSKQAFFCTQYGQKMMVNASQIFIDDAVEFKFNSGPPKGMYKIFISDSAAADIIIDRDKEIELSTAAESFNNNLKVLKGEDNRIYYAYLQYKKARIHDLTTIINTLKPANTKKQNPQTEERVNFIKGVMTYKIQTFADSIRGKDTSLFVSKVIKAIMLPNLNLWQINHPDEKKYNNDIEYLLGHFFDNIDFSDSAFLRTEILYKTISYYIDKLALPRNVVGFNMANDRILNLAKANPAVYKYSLKLLLEIYENTQAEDVFVKLFNETLSKQKDAVTKTEYERFASKVTIINSLKAGSQAPDIGGKDTLGNEIKLSSVKSPVTLLMLWSAENKNGEETIKQFSEVYKTYKDKGFQIFAVCLDSNNVKWKSMLGKLKPEWINVINPQGKIGEISKIYNTWALPSLYIMDNKMKIATRPMNIDYVKKEFETVFKK